MSKRNRWIAALLLAVGALGAVTGLAGTAQAVVDQTRMCTVAITAVNSEDHGVQEDVKQADVVADFYKVADIVQDDDGKISVTPLEPYRQSVPTDLATKDKAAWEAAAQQAAAVALDGDHAKTTLSADGTVQTGKLNSGVYLLLAHGSKLDAKAYVRRTTTGNTMKISTVAATNDYTYTYAPQLISLPDISAAESAQADGDWNYGDAAHPHRIALAPAITKNVNGLELSATVKNYAKGQGDPVLVFHITGVDTTYDAYTALTFQQAGTQSVTIADIPKGATVKVKQVYSGACYAVSGENTKTVKLPETGTVSAAFTSDYNRSKNGGTGVVNHFQYTTGSGGNVWKWTTTPASAAAQ